MGVYIPNMKFPQNCDECDLLYDCCACGVTHKRMDFETMDRVRNPHCPLVPVPPHGRLIDADELEKRARAVKNFENQESLVVVLGGIKCAPTIIPAEEAQT